jgi:hypothetical protein
MTVLPVSTAVAIPYDELVAFCERHHLRRMWLYGSVLGDEFTPDSDIDILVEFDPAHIPGWEFYIWDEELADMLGYPVDLGTPNGLRFWLRDEIMASARLVYERPD